MRLLSRAQNYPLCVWDIFQRSKISPCAYGPNFGRREIKIWPYETIFRKEKEQHAPVSGLRRTSAKSRHVNLQKRGRMIPCLVKNRTTPPDTAASPIHGSAIWGDDVLSFLKTVLPETPATKAHEGENISINGASSLKTDLYSTENSEEPSG